jgi:hypothetical protein
VMAGAIRERIDLGIGQEASTAVELIERRELENSVGN